MSSLEEDFSEVEEEYVIDKELEEFDENFDPDAVLIDPEFDSEDEDYDFNNILSNSESDSEEEDFFA
ncbi:hypothetical protein EOM09_00140 [bacterium]|nr:hypothetical protein [bacterium]